MLLQPGQDLPVSTDQHQATPSAGSSLPCGIDEALLERCRRADTAAIETVLETVFGHAAFRPGQLDIIQEALQGASCLAVLPTGTCIGGPALIFEVHSGTELPCLGASNAERP